MTWTVVVAKAAQKQLARFPVKDQDKLATALVAMETDPFFGDIIKLEGERGTAGGDTSEATASFLPLIESRGHFRSTQSCDEPQPRINERAFLRRESRNGY